MVWRSPEGPLDFEEYLSEHSQKLPKPGKNHQESRTVLGAGIFYTLTGQSGKALEDT